MSIITTPLQQLQTLLANRPAMQNLLSVNSADLAKLRIHYREATDDGDDAPPRVIIGMGDGARYRIKSSPQVENLTLWAIFEVGTPSQYDGDIHAQETWIAGKCNTLLTELATEIKQGTGEMLRIATIELTVDPFAILAHNTANPDGAAHPLKLWRWEWGFDIV